MKKKPRKERQASTRYCLLLFCEILLAIIAITLLVFYKKWLTSTFNKEHTIVLFSYHLLFYYCFALVIEITMITLIIITIGKMTELRINRKFAVEEDKLKLEHETEN